jgi:hypothetical protein
MHQTDLQRFLSMLLIATMMKGTSAAGKPTNACGSGQDGMSLLLTS